MDVAHPAALGLPLRWRAPRLVFVNSMSDLFHPKVPGEFITSVFAVMSQTPHRPAVARRGRTPGGS